jgi:DNA-binding response OmpR family regulator
MIHSKLILLIDDDTEDQEIFIDALKQIDSSILCLSFTDGEEAIRLLETDIIEVPDLIFLDLNMPKFSGKQCLGQLKNIEKLKHTPVIIYTTSSDKKDKDDTKELGADHFLIKPSRFDDLRNHLLTILSQNGRHGNA